MSIITTSGRDVPGSQPRPAAIQAAPNPSTMSAATLASCHDHAGAAGHRVIALSVGIGLHNIGRMLLAVRPTPSKIESALFELRSPAGSPFERPDLFGRERPALPGR